MFLLFSGTNSISAATIADYLAEDGTVGAMDLYDETVDDDLGADPGDVLRTQRDASAEGQSETGVLAEEVMLELDYRRTLVGPEYPILTEKSVAKLGVASWEEAPVYSFLVALNARYLWNLPADVHIAARLFERLVVPALARYWGGEAIHFGWPRDEGEEPTFRAALPRVAARMRERLSVDPSEIGHSQKDLEVDAVAWRQLDERRGNSVMLCQCAIGSEWEDKGVRVRLWEKLINFAVAPLGGLAFPFIPEVVRDFTDMDWLLLCAKGGIPFDRLRIAQLVRREAVPDEVLKGMIDWTRDIAPRLAAACG